MPLPGWKYTLFALYKKEAGCGRVGCRCCVECALSYDGIDERHREEIARLYDKIATRAREDPRRGIKNLEREALHQYRSKINNDLLSAFGPYESNELKFKSIGERNDTRYYLPLVRSRIRVIW